MISGRRAMALGALLSFFAGCSDDVDPTDATGGSGGAIGGAGGSGGVQNSGGAGGTGTGGIANAATEEDLAVLKALAAITEAVRTNEDVWPGYTFMSMPIVPVNAGERALIVKHPSPPEGLPPLMGVPDDITQALGVTHIGTGYEDLLQPGEPMRFFADLGDKSSAFAFAYPFAEQLIGTPLPPAIEEMLTATLVVHEMFHMYQQDWTSEFGPDLCAFPLEDDDLLTLSRVEHLALSEALTAADPTTHLEDFVTARLVRHGSAPTIRDAEDYWESIEGTAHFIDGLYSERAGYTSDPSGQWAAELVDEFDVADLGRDRHYETGAALAALLDRMGVPFREEIAVGGRFTEIAATALAIDEASAQTRLQELLERYDVESSIKPGVIQAKEDYIAARDAAVDAVEAGQGHLIVFEFLMSGAFKNAGSYTLDDCTTYFVDSSFYLTTPTLDAKILDKAVRGAPDLSEHAFRSMSAGPFTLDGQAQEWVPGTYPFESLSITFDDWAVDAAVAGTLVITDSEVRISLVSP